MTQQINETNRSYPVVERMTVTPDLATKWLEGRNANNRKISDAHVVRLAQDMTDGNWQLTHMGIAFDRDGVLIDGQHRLWAVVMSGKSVDMHVWRNLSQKSILAIDNGRTRTMADILKLSGENGDVNSYQIATLRAMLSGMGSPITFSPVQMQEHLKVHQRAIDFAMEILPHTSANRGISDSITRAVIARAYYSVNEFNLRDFCEKLTTGIISGPSESVLVALRTFLSTQRCGTYHQRRTKYRKFERVLRSWLDGRNPSKITMANTELFPLPQEVDSNAKTDCTSGS
jgi:hypothetical protein